MHSTAADVALKRISRTALIIRWIVSAHLALLLLQLVAAIAAVAGAAAAFQVHFGNARLVAVAAVLQAAGVLSAGSGRAGWFVRSMSLAVAAGAVLQVYLGGSGGMAWHVTLAMTLWALSVAIFVRVWQPGWTS